MTHQQDQERIDKLASIQELIGNKIQQISRALPGYTITINITTGSVMSVLGQNRPLWSCSMFSSLTVSDDGEVLADEDIPTSSSAVPTQVQRPEPAEPSPLATFVQNQVDAYEAQRSDPPPAAAPPDGKVRASRAVFPDAAKEPPASEAPVSAPTTGKQVPLFPDTPASPTESAPAAAVAPPAPPPAPPPQPSKADGAAARPKFGRRPRPAK